MLQDTSELNASQSEALKALRNSHTLIHQALHSLEHGGSVPINKGKIAIAVNAAVNALVKL